MIRIAVVEDNPDLCEELVFQLRHEGYDAEGFPDGASLDRGFLQFAPEIVVLDLNLPGEDGLSIAARLRSLSDVGIVMLTARGTLSDRVIGLETGADAYLVKPVDRRELLAVLQSVYRRISDKPITASGVWQLSPAQRLVCTPEGQKIALTDTEFRLLMQLAKSYPNVAQRRALIESLGHEYLQFDERRLEAAMSRLRRKLRSDESLPSPLRSARAQGYVFTELIQILAPT